MTEMTWEQLHDELVGQLAEKNAEIKRLRAEKEMQQKKFDTLKEAYDRERRRGIPISGS